jgi:hypothetical protein
MRFSIFILVVLSLLLLGAHFMRFGNEVGVIGCIVLLGLLFLRKPWVARLMQVALIAGAFEWAYSLYYIVQARLAQGIPFTRLAIILGSVIAVTLLSALLFESKTMKQIYGRHRDGEHGADDSGSTTPP